MARNVTEPEIDALLARGQEPRPTVVARDFREPRSLSAADVDALRRPLEAAATAVREAVQLMTPVELGSEPVDIGETTLDAVLRDDGTDFVGALCDGTAGASLVTLEVGAAVALAEIALGADENEAAEERELAPLERTLLDRLLVRALERACQSLQIPAKDARAFASRAALKRELGPDGDRRRLALRIPIAIGSARVVVHVLLAGVKAPAPKTPAAAKDAKKAALPAEIAPAKVDVCAVLARADILLTELLALEPGDVITLDVAPGESIAVEIEGQPRARARFGTRDGRLAVRIQEILKPAPPR